MTTPKHDVLEHNVEQLIESGGEPPRLDDIARARIRAELVAKHGAVATPSRVRRPAIAIGVGLAAIAAAALIVTRWPSGATGVVQDGATMKLADGTTYIVDTGAKVAVLGPRRVRVEGAALLDVAPGKGTFIVETARGRIEVLGTRFLVDAEAARTTAAVVRGEVKLATDQGEVVLHAGEQGVAEPNHAPVRGPAPRLSHLVSWAQAARRESHDVEPIHHGTLFARDPGVRSHPPWGEEYPLPITRLALDIVVEDQVARIALDQTFHNAATQDLEGVYRFAIPPDAALQRLAMYVDGKLEESAVVERMQARRIYEELVYRRVDPALLEWAGTGRLALRVFPIPALRDKRLVLAYTQSLPKLYDDYTLTVPLPEVDQPVGELDVTMRVKGCASCELTSTSHHIEVERAGDDAIVRYRRTAETIGDSFVVHVRDPRKQGVVATYTDGADRYLLVRTTAKSGAPHAYRPRTWVILDDVSASRDAQELHAQSDLVDAFARELDENDRLAVIAFDVEARQQLAPTRVLDVDRTALRAKLKMEGGVGATDFGIALDAATKALAGVDPDDAMIVYLGDGVITAGAQQLDVLRAKLAGKAQFIGVGVGDGPDTQTLRALANATAGYSTTIDLADDLGWRAFDLVAALNTPRVTGIDARLLDAAGQLVPATIYPSSAQLADGEQLEVVVKLAGSGTPKTLEVTGAVDGAHWSMSVDVDHPSHDGAGYLPRLWAQRHIAARLLAKHEPVVVPPCDGKGCPSEAELREARDEAIRKEIVALGKRYFLLSRHTSLLVLENDAMYAQYGVTKGSGETWAPYALPATIPVAPVAVPPVPSQIAEDAELVRTPLQIFYGQPRFRDRSEPEQSRWWRRGGEDEHRVMTITTSPSDALMGKGELASDKSGDDSEKQQVVTTDQLAGVAFSGSTTLENEYVVDGVLPTERADRAAFHTSLGTFTGTKSGKELWLGAPMRFTNPGDTAFDDITAFVPALLPDVADAWRRRITTTKGAHVIDAAARTLLAAARAQLPSGIYRWGELELAVDDARRIGWRRTSDAGLAETASYDGATWTRRYAELDLDVTRPVSTDDVALAFAYLPIWIADPAHYAQWFDVKARGTNEVALQTETHGKTTVALVLRFDDQHRLVSVVDGAGVKLVEITWSATGPTAARVNGEAMTVGFTGEAIADAPAWAHQGTQPGVAVELPAHMAAYWQSLLAKEPPGDPAWRRAERQLMVSAAATQDRSTLLAAYQALRGNGGVELGDLALASAAVVEATTDAQLADAVAPMMLPVRSNRNQLPLVAYLAASHAYLRSPKPAVLAPQTHDGLVGALWSLRSMLAKLQAGEVKVAVDDLIAMGNHAIELRLIGASLVSQYGAKPDDIESAWDSVAVGVYRNVARVRAAEDLLNRGNYDASAERIASLVAELDLDAMPPSLATASYAFSASRRGAAGWEIVWAMWRDKVLAGGSFAHVMALLPQANQHPADVMAILSRAAMLARDADDQLAVAYAAVAAGQSAWAETVLTPLLKASPSREMYQLASQLALAQGQTERALADLEAAQDLGSDERVDINVVRQELGQIITVARQLAVQSTGPTRARAIQRALHWGDRWRAVDAGNTRIDEQLGELLLAVGDDAGAWRQLSSTIERDPWSGEGYMTVADAFERQGKVEAALPFWQQAIVIDQTNPTPQLRKAQALIALGRSAEGDALLAQIANHKWHDVWSNVAYQAKDLLARAKQSH